MTMINSGSFQTVLCPKCANAIQLFSGLAYGYCHVCGEHIAYEDAQNRRFDPYLIGSWDGDEYYQAIGGSSAPLEHLDIAIEKGCSDAIIAAGMKCVYAQQYTAAKQYFEKGVKQYDERAKAGMLICRGQSLNTIDAAEDWDKEYDQLSQSAFDGLIPQGLLYDIHQKIPDIIQSIRDRYVSYDSYVSTYTPTTGKYVVTGDFGKDLDQWTNIGDDLSISYEERQAFIEQFHKTHSDWDPGLPDC